MIDFEERIFVFSFLLIPNAVAQISFKCGVNMLKAKDFENLWYFAILCCMLIPRLTLW